MKLQRGFMPELELHNWSVLTLCGGGLEFELGDALTVGTHYTTATITFRPPTLRGHGGGALTSRPRRS